MPVGHVWRQNPSAFKDQVALEHINEVGECEFHTFMLSCTRGMSSQEETTARSCGKVVFAC